MFDCLLAIRTVLKQGPLNRASNVSSSTGLVRKSTAPSFIALTVDGMSPRPVRKITGIEVFVEIDFCTSRPPNPGILRSRIRQAQEPWRGEARKDHPEVKTRTRLPLAPSNVRNASATLASSSTI